MSISKNYYRLHRKGHYCVKKRIPVVPSILKFVKRIVFPSTDIPFTVEIGEGAQFPHRAIGVVIQGRVKIGKNVKIESGVCLGGVAGKGVPELGDNVFLGAGCCVIGGVHIGDNCIIGAGAVVVDDIPDNSIAVGVPAQVIKTVGD